MTPFDLHRSYQEEKRAFIGAALGLANSAAFLPGMVQLGGMALKGLGGLTRWGGLARAGTKVEQFGTKAVGQMDRFLNNPRAGVLGTYDLSGLPGVKKWYHPLNLIGMNTKGRLNMTLPRAAVWAGGALAAGQTVKSVMPQQPKVAAAQILEHLLEE